MTQPVQRPTFTVAEAADMLGVSRGHAYELVRRGEIPSIRLGRRLVVPRRALEGLVGDLAPRPTLSPPASPPAGDGDGDGDVVTAYLCIPVTLDKTALPALQLR